jgi:hypothetical protein
LKKIGKRKRIGKRKTGKKRSGSFQQLPHIFVFFL